MGTEGDCCAIASGSVLNYSQAQAHCTSLEQCTQVRTDALLCMIVPNGVLLPECDELYSSDEEEEEEEDAEGWAV